MDASAKYQLNVIMDKFKEMKSKYTELEVDYKYLEVLHTKQKERLGELESCRNQLIKLLREKVDKVDTFKTKIESLQKENSNLNATIQDQNLLINEYSAIIDQLKKENTLLKNKRNEPTNDTDKVIQKPNQVIVNGNFSHPSFTNTSSPTSAKKQKKKSPLILQNRYSNLDILINGVQKKEESIKENKTASAKKRRLFSLEDEMIDLTIENHK